MFVEVEGLKSMGTAVLEADGTVVKASGDLDGDSSTVATLYSMLLVRCEESKECFRHVTVAAR